MSGKVLIESDIGRYEKKDRFLCVGGAVFAVIGVHIGFYFPEIVKLFSLSLPTETNEIWMRPLLSAIGCFLIYQLYTVTAFRPLSLESKRRWKFFWRYFVRTFWTIYLFLFIQLLIGSRDSDKAFSIFWNEIVWWIAIIVGVFRGMIIITLYDITSPKNIPVFKQNFEDAFDYVFKRSKKRYLWIPIAILIASGIAAVMFVIIMSKQNDIFLAIFLGAIVFIGVGLFSVLFYLPFRFIIDSLLFDDITKTY